MRELTPGDVLGRYRIEAIAGRGGMGVVYRARQQRPDRLVAIKVIAPELAADPSFKARFERESTIAAEIEHPNVIPVYEVDEDQGLVFIAMRYVAGGVDLGQLMRQGEKFDARRVLRIVSQVAGALDAAHSRGLVHRDVKPGNILVAPNDQVYLTDFGLTKRVTDSRGMTQTGTFVGTVDYIAPEQVEGKPIDGRADQYALGCVTYQLLSGKVPFPRDSDVAKIFAHVNDPIPRLQGVLEPVADAVQRSMAKDPEQRFASAGEFVRAIESAMRGPFQAPATVPAPPATIPAAAPTQLAPEPPTAEQPADRSRRTLILLLIAAALVAGLATGLAFAFGSGGSHATPTRPPIPTTPLTPSTSTTSSTPGDTPSGGSHSVSAVESCLRGEGDTVSMNKPGVGGEYKELEVNTPNSLYFVSFFDNASDARSFANAPGPHYDDFGTIVVGPTDGKPDQRKVEACVH